MATIITPTERCRNGNGRPATAERVMMDHAYFGACYFCCETCNYDQHICHFCGERLNHNSTEGSYKNLKLHYLKDCRPDLVDGSYYLPEIRYDTDGPMV